CARSADQARTARDRSAGDRDRPRHADQLRRQQALDVSKKTLTRLLRYGILAAALAWPSVAGAATTPTAPVFDGRGNLVQTPFIPAPEPQRLTEQRAERIFLAYPKVRDWLDRYPTKGRTVQAEYDDDDSVWRVKVWWGAAGQIADGKVDDRSGVVTEAWTG